MSQELIACIQVCWLNVRRFLRQHFMVPATVHQATEKDIFEHLTDEDRTLQENLRENRICTRCGRLFGPAGPYLRRQRLCRGCVLNCSVFGNRLRHASAKLHKCKVDVNLGCGCGCDTASLASNSKV